MCGRYALVDGKRIFMTFAALRQAEERGEPLAILPQYNVLPMRRTMPVIAVQDHHLTVELMQWWLVPHRSPEFSNPYTAFNARAEKLEQSPMFKPYFRSSRCLIPADAFYENIEGEKSKALHAASLNPERYRMIVRMKDESPMLFAGLFSVWTSTETGERRPSFTIITTEPNALMSTFHHRMPVIVRGEDAERWLDRNNRTTETLRSLLKPYPADAMKAYPVRVPQAGQNDPACFEPAVTV